VSSIGDGIGIFLAGDVMTGRGIDQILVNPSRPELHESYVRDARAYVALAEERNGPIARAVDPAYVWGVALDVLADVEPDARIVNLETSITQSDAWSGEKGIHYRMHPGNIDVLAVAGLDCCSLANNHVLDYGVSGLEETMETLRAAGIGFSGAGRDLEEARAPAVIDLRSKGRILVFALGVESSGVPCSWGATAARSGVNFVPDLCQETLVESIAMIAKHHRAGDLVVVSIHWGGNWGYSVSAAQRRFVHGLIDSGLVDCVYGHSSHHAKGLEIHAGRPVLYGCGDLINDYEGISGQEHFRGDLGLMYFLRFNAMDRRLAGLEIVPLTRRRFTLGRASAADAVWLAEVLDRQSKPFGTRVAVGPNDHLHVSWQH
jgi:poly-gamma-glutamate synthesis protein (capsule biosynthesis protein)